MASRRTSSVRIPKYRKQTKREGPDLTFVELQGRRVYLGPYDSAERTARYHQVLAEFDANGGELPIPHDEITIWKSPHASGRTSRRTIASRTERPPANKPTSGKC